MRPLNRPSAALSSIRSNVLQGCSSNLGSCLWVQESDELLQRQFEELSKGLQDEAPAVRMTATSGICSLLNMYWELVPAGTTAAYLKRLTGSYFTPSTSCLACCRRRLAQVTINQSSKDPAVLTSPQMPHRVWILILCLKPCCTAIPCNVGLVSCDSHSRH